MQTSDTVPLGAQPLAALCERIERERAFLHVIRQAQHPYPYLEVRDSSNYGIHVGFASTSEWQTYVQIIGRGREAHEHKEPSIKRGLPELFVS